MVPKTFVGDQLNVKSLEVKGLAILNLRVPSANSIKNLEDIQYFTGLAALDYSENQLTGLDVSTNTALTQLSCSKNQLTHLDIRGMRSVIDLSVQEATGETNAIDTPKVHENLKDHAQIKKAKTARGEEMTIETYSTSARSTTYTLECSDYDPTEKDEQNCYKEEAPSPVPKEERNSSPIARIIEPRKRLPRCGVFMLKMSYLCRQHKYVLV